MDYVNSHDALCRNALPRLSARHPLLLTLFALPLKSFGSFMLKRPCLPIKLRAMTARLYLDVCTCMRVRPQRGVCAVVFFATHTSCAQSVCAVAAPCFAEWRRCCCCCRGCCCDNNYYETEFITLARVQHVYTLGQTEKRAVAQQEFQ